MQALPPCSGSPIFGSRLSHYSDGTLAAALTASADVEGDPGWENWTQNGHLLSSSGEIANTGTAVAQSEDTGIAILPFNSGPGYSGGPHQVVGDYYFEHPHPSYSVVLNYGFPGYVEENGSGRASILGYVQTFNLGGYPVDPTPVIYSVTLNPPLVAGSSSTATITGDNFGISQPTVTLSCSSDNPAPPCTNSDVAATVTAWTSSSITATLAASTSASGNYDLTVTSNGTPTYGNQFQAGPGEQAQSNKGGPVMVTCSPSVVIGGRPILISPGSTYGTYTASLTSAASPPGGVYTWSTNNPSMVGFSQSTPSTGPSANNITLVIISTNGTATITLTYISPCNATATDSFTFALTNDTTVVAWINAGPIEPGTGQLSPSDPVYQDLVNNPGQCAALLAGWASSGQAGYGQANNGLTAQEIQFAIQFLNAGSGNPNNPPSNPNTTAYVNGQNTGYINDSRLITKSPTVRSTRPQYVTCRAAKLATAP